MKTRFIISIILFLLAGVMSASAALEIREWEIDGVKREALVWMPASSEVLPPLVFVFHGHGGSMRNGARSFRIHEIWPEAIVVYMQALVSKIELKRRGSQVRFL
ncbi:MAG: hypothetical protein JXR25_02185 [Pontiellaceae bacterium]|nr:hypothetical protein [Pontiellaceae bacterium]MBN2783609.1 hypothetical protein [Pontiellaceae bacterium]